MRDHAALSAQPNAAPPAAGGPAVVTASCPSARVHARAPRRGPAARAGAAVLAAVLALAGVHAPADTLDARRPLSDLPSNTWAIREGLPHHHINDIAQTPDGSLWIATFEGLVRYSGTDFRVLRDDADSGLPDFAILGLSVTADGGLLVTTAGRGLALWRAGEWVPLPAVATDPDDRIEAAVLDAAGRLWIASRGRGLGRVDPAGALVRVSGMPAGRVFSLREDGEGRIWVGGAFGLVRVEGETARAFLPEDGFPGGLVRALLPLPDGRIVVASGAGVFVGDEAGFHPLDPRLVGVASRDIAQAADGSLLVATGLEGLLRLTPDGGLQHFDESNGLLSNRVTALLTDRDGDLWIGTTAGLQQLADLPVGMLDARHGLDPPGVRTLLAWPDGSVFVGGAGGVFRVRDGVAAPVLRADGRRFGLVLSLARGVGDSLLVGNDVGEVWRWREGEGEAVVLAAGALPTGTEARGLVEPAEGVLWVGSNVGLFRASNGQLERFGRPHGLPSDFVMRLLQGRDGRLWVATDGGLAVFDGAVFGQVPLRGRSDAREVFGLLEVADGALWVATDRGLRRVRGEDVAEVPPDAGVPHSKLFDVIEDAAGDLWVTSNQGMTRLPRAEVEAVADGRATRVQALTLDEFSGMGVRQASGGASQSAVALPGGEVWAGTAAGIARVRLADLVRAAPPPGVVLESLWIDDQVVPLAQGMVLPPGVKRLEFSVASPTFRSPGSLRYRHRLEGFDDGWVESAAIDRRRQYTSLPPGDYVFESQASADGERWSEGNLRFAFTVAPAWWQRPGMWALGVLAAGLLVWSGQHLRTRALRARQRRLEALVAERTSALDESNRQLAALNARLGAQSDSFERQALTDPLTGLPNRRALQERLAGLLADGEPLVFGLLDVDHFKRINDSFSHEAGDAVLRAVAQAARAALGGSGRRRQDPFVARWGGEEFALLWPRLTPGEARASAERVRAAIASLRLDPPLDAVRVTASIGLAGGAAAGLGAVSADTLFRQADERVYAAKAAGRDRVMD